MFYSKKLNEFNNLRHCFFSRKNGFSNDIYKSLNCGLGSNDKKENILKNLDFVSKSMNVKKDNLILMNQTHSKNVILLDERNIKNNRLNSDALITKLNNVAIAVLTADCVPIILYDELNKVIGCIHAGWKGASSGIIENTVKMFEKISVKTKIIAAVGPCIGNKSYEVGLDFYKNFLSSSEKNKVFFKNIPKNRFLFDIRAYVNEKLKNCGINNVDNIEYDTFKDNENFFSYRRSKKLDQPDYGRCISTICLKT
ncbi:MAG: peptidoglycan editing factor PgeF [Pelagibacteraceae bacterium]